MVTHGVRHECDECSNVTEYHKFDHESEGDVVYAFCAECDTDTPHTILD